MYWLIVKHDGLGRRVFTTRLTGSEEVLPIFGHAEEAGEFLRLGKLENGWRVRGTGVGELVSVLLGLCQRPKGRAGPDARNRCRCRDTGQFREHGTGKLHRVPLEQPPAREVRIE